MSNEYSSALKLAKKSIQSCTAKKLPAALPVLDEILADKNIAGEIPLGLIDVPLDLIVGTKTSGRASSFAPNFMPALADGTEFASKWEYLYEAHLQEGIREPVKAYEYLNKYYVLEGNKRVSVLKYCRALSIPAYVTRVLPVRSDDPEIRLYYEYLDFYNATSINYLILTHEYAYLHLTELVGKRRYDRWTMKERVDFRSAYNKFSDVYESLRDPSGQITAGDALVVYLELFSYDRLCRETPEEIRENLGKIGSYLQFAENNRPVDLSMEPGPQDEPKRNLLGRILPPAKKQDFFKIAFIHAKNAKDSSWTYSHELGRSYLENQFGDNISCTVYNDISGTKEAISAIVSAVVDHDCDIIFTTSAEFLEASLKCAVQFPDVKILNCSLNTPHKYIRTYYGRMFEAKFLNGVLAGTLCDNGKIGYIADHPICGMPANINAFAIGAHMVNPNARVYLEWSTTLENEGVDLAEKFRSQGISLISSQDMITPGKASRKFGLFRIDGRQPVNLACPVWNWGKYYEQILLRIQNGIWEREEGADGRKALNYWWGISAGVIDIFWSSEISSGTRYLLELMKRSICRMELYPFFGLIPAQDGSIHGTEGQCMYPWEILTMDWLCENVEGRIPQRKELCEDSQNIVKLLGITNEKDE